MCEGRSTLVPDTPFVHCTTRSPTPPSLLRSTSYPFRSPELFVVHVFRSYSPRKVLSPTVHVSKAPPQVEPDQILVSPPPHRPRSTCPLLPSSRSPVPFLDDTSCPFYWKFHELLVTRGIYGRGAIQGLVPRLTHRRSLAHPHSATSGTLQQSTVQDLRETGPTPSVTLCVTVTAALRTRAR